MKGIYLTILKRLFSSMHIPPPLDSGLGAAVADINKMTDFLCHVFSHLSAMNIFLQFTFVVSHIDYQKWIGWQSTMSKSLRCFFFFLIWRSVWCVSLDLEYNWSKVVRSVSSITCMQNRVAMTSVFSSVTLHTLWQCILYSLFS